MSGRRNSKTSLTGTVIDFAEARNAVRPKPASARLVNLAERRAWLVGECRRTHREGGKGTAARARAFLEAIDAVEAEITETPARSPADVVLKAQVALLAIGGGTYFRIARALLEQLVAAGGRVA